MEDTDAGLDILRPASQRVAAAAPETSSQIPIILAWLLCMLGLGVLAYGLTLQWINEQPGPTPTIINVSTIPNPPTR